MVTRNVRPERHRFGFRRRGRAVVGRPLEGQVAGVARGAVPDHETVEAVRVVHEKPLEHVVACDAGEHRETEVHRDPPVGVRSTARMCI